MLAVALGACSSGASASPPSTESVRPGHNTSFRDQHDHNVFHHNTRPFDDGPGDNDHNDHNTPAARAEGTAGDQRNRRREPRSDLRPVLPVDGLRVRVVGPRRRAGTGRSHRRQSRMLGVGPGDAVEQTVDVPLRPGGPAVDGGCRRRRRQPREQPRDRLRIRGHARRSHQPRSGRHRTSRSRRDPGRGLRPGSRRAKRLDDRDPRWWGCPPRDRIVDRHR